ncbi:uncharacterized protein LOC102080509 isoform X3 [Oreochromis niloticus]|nr:uncharacterized protein LOC102080509 isoform X3 [Oreochromis niloticus]
MDILANFLGHDIRVHREYYRLPEGTLELAKVSKVLIALEQGRLSDFKGMSLDQIQINPNEEMQEDVESDLSETDASKESSFSSSTSRSQRSRSQPTTDEFDEAPTGSSTPKRRKETGSDIDDPKEGTSHTHRTPCFASGTSTKEKESDTDATKMGPPRFKQGQWTTDEPDGDHTTAGTSKKRTWTSAEVQAVEKTLMSFIESGKVPGKSDCVACIEASPKALKNRTWTAVKFYVKNRITAMQRKAAKRV